MGKQRSLSRKSIKQKLRALHSKLPDFPTASEEIFQVPDNLILQIHKSKYSQESVQELATFMCLYLGLLRPVKVTIGVESSEYMMMGDGDQDRLGRVGLYKVRGADHSEIEITKKFRYEMHHILAILVHEATHNYLHYHGVKEEKEDDNETLTDLASAYLGLGHIVFNGYKPISWVSNEKYDWLSGSHSWTEHSTTIGYVDSATIRNAVVESTELRGFDVNDVLSKFAFPDRIYIYLNLLLYIRKRKAQIKKEKQYAQVLKENRKSVSATSDKIKTIRDKYKDIKSTFGKITSGGKTLPGDKDVYLEITTILNELSTGEVENKINFIIEKIDAQEITDLEKIDLAPLQKDINEMNLVIEKWGRAASYIKEKK